MPARDAGCPFIAPEIGITPTPAIDLQTGTLYVLARTKEGAGALSSGRYVQKLHALAITTGAEKFGGPVEIKASVKGRGAARAEVIFDPLRELPRAALLLVNGQVYLTWGSSCDVRPYYGWVMAYDARTLAQTAVFNTSPDAEESGIWQSDNGPAADEEGNVYAATGNGKFTAAANGRDYGDSLLKLGLAKRSLNVLDWFTPFNEQILNREDDDLGSGGPLLVPRQPGAPHGLALVGGKDGSLFVLDRGHLGKYQESGNSHAVQVIRFRDGIYAAPAYWKGHVYILAGGDYLSAFALNQGKLSAKKRWAHRGSAIRERLRQSRPTGPGNGIVWLIETKTWNGADSPAILHAYDAANVARELYNSEQNSARDRAGLTLRFTIPTVVGGRVYVDAKRRVDVYGLLAPH